MRSGKLSFRTCTRLLPTAPSLRLTSQRYEIKRKLIMLHHQRSMRKKKDHRVYSSLETLTATL
ncbi:hypothetical protein EVA_03096 [gut metagenome]|uniref:Uncharacterized protein n=1 Tax=gut metagenome TaxID=749906 RepID=J9H4M9_9ZZZZ